MSDLDTEIRSITKRLGDSKHDSAGHRIVGSFAPHWDLTDLTDLGVRDASPNQIRTVAWEIIEALVGEIARLETEDNNE